MSLKNILLAPRYGIYRPGTGTIDFELTSYGSGFKLSTSIEVQEGTYEEVGNKIKNYIDKAKNYTSDNDLALLGYLVKGLEVGSTHIIKFNDKGITLASLITVDARKVQFIYEKYSDKEYALQLSLTRESSISFAWSDSKLTGDFYFNIKRSGDEDVTSVTGYTNFHLGNAAAAKPVVLSAGVVKRKPLPKPKDPTKAENADTEKELEKVDHTYVRLRSRSAKGLTVKEIVSMFTSAETEIPDVLDKVAFYDFAILTKSDKNTETKEFAVVIDCMITIKDTPLRSKLTIHTKSTEKEDTKDKEHSFTFSAVVTVDVHQFQLRFDKSSSGSEVGKKSSWSILASYAHSGTVTLDIQKMLKTLFGQESDIPALSLDLHQPKAFFYYQRSTATDDKEKNEGDQENKKSKGKLLFGAGASIHLSVKELPIAGSVLVEMKALDFDEVLFMYSSDQLSQKDIKPLVDAKMLDENFKPRKGLSLSAGVVIDGKKEFYTFGGEVKDVDNKKQEHNDPQNADTPTNDPTPLNKVEVSKELPADASSDAKWYIIDKKLGPVNFQRLGLKYQDGRAYIILDASIKTSSFSLQAMGLGLGFKPDWEDMQPSFHLRGLGLSYKTDTIEISGAFLRGQQSMMINGEAQTIDTYNGAAMIKMKKFSISAIGSYAEYKEQDIKKTSLFVYGVFQGNIGGPPIFYVTGIAAGFGYNRKINAPEISDVADYPLVALAMSSENKSLGEVLSSLETPMSNGKLPIDISPGNYWLALGVKFTSFKIIESFALLTVNFGAQTEFNILGLSRLTFPEKSFRDKIGMAAPIIYIELAIKISYTVGGDVFKVDGLITPESYVFSKNCRLTGGFAFYVWVEGEHAGDFVLTLGGYFPNKTMPAHYPQVPRIQLLWMLSDSIMIKGQLYFALTPSSIMMGGRWELHIVTTNVKVTFIMWLDILLEWAPFYYEISMGLIFRIEAHIPMKICTIHLNFELRAQLDLWGPDFSGKALLDLGVISFEVSFGKTPRGGKKTIQFNDFTNQFLPKSKDDPKTFDTIAIQPDGGVINILEQDKEKYYVVNPLQASIQIDSNVPIKRAMINDGANIIDKHNYPDMQRLGIKPCGIGTSSAPQALYQADSPSDTWTSETAESADLELLLGVAVTFNNSKSDSFKATINSKSYPKALWSQPTEATESSDTMIPNIPSGFQLVPKASPTVSELKNYDFSTFKEVWTNDHETSKVVFAALTSAQQGQMSAINYGAADVGANRNELLKEANKLFFSDDTFAIDTDDVNHVYTRAAHEYFRSKPANGSVGKVPNKS